MNESETMELKTSTSELKEAIISIKFYNDSIVIANPEKLPENLRINDLYKEHESLPNNPLLAKVFFYTGYIDAWGRGILNIIKFLKAEKLGKPMFEQSGGSFRIKFERSKIETTQKTTKKTTQKIIDLILKNPKVTRKELSEQIGISEDGIKYNLIKLAKSGKIKRIGPDKGGHWVIINVANTN